MLIHFVSLAGNPLHFCDLLAVLSARAVYPGAEITVWADLPIAQNAWKDKLLAIAKERIIPAELYEVSSGLGGLATQSDYIRYNILYQLGGLYLDTDTISVRSLLKLPSMGLLVPEETPAGHFNNGIIYAPTARDPVMADILAECKSRIERRDDIEWSGCILGPDLFWDVLKHSEGSFVRLPRKVCHFHSWYDWRLWFAPGDVHPDIRVCHWFNSWSGDQVRQLVTPRYIRDSISLFAKCARFGLTGKERRRTWLDL